jgi:chemotaxis response regulator CheB
MTLPDMKCSSLCVAIVASSDHQRACLKQILEENALQVVDNAILDSSASDLNADVANVVLVNLDDSDEESLDFYIDQTELPVLFNDSASIRMDDTPSGRAWGRRLADKLIRLANIEADFSEIVAIETDSQPELSDAPALHLVDTDEVSPPGQSLVDEVEIIDEEVAELTWGRSLEAEDNFQEGFSGSESLQENQFDSWEAVESSQEKAEVIWVLGASIGGPDAVKRFLMSLSGNIPAGFILAQHIGSGFVSLLVEQLGRVTNINVMCAEEGRVISSNQLVVVPVEKKLGFYDDGRIKLTESDTHSIYSPSIDDVMTEVAGHYGQNARAIVFSGMGNDGLRGAQAISGQGGVIWAQDADSCVISTMADTVREAGLVSETATPENLAVNLVQSMSEEAVT